MKIIKLFFLFITIIACKDQIADNESYNTIHLSGDEVGINILENYLENVRIVKCQTSNNANFGYVSNIIVHDSLFYILDNSRTRIQVFNFKGEHIKKIFKLGKGPGEYLRINQFDVDMNGNVYILTSSKIVIYNKDFSFKDEIKLENSAFVQDIIFYNKENFYTHSTLIKKNKISYSLTKFNNQQIKQYFPVEYKFRFGQKYFSRATDDEFYYNSGLLSNEIYRIFKDEIKLQYKILTVEPFLSLSDVSDKSQIFMSGITINKYHTLGNIHCLDDLLFFNIRKGKSRKTVLYDKRINEANSFSTIRLNCGILVNIYGRIPNENCLIGILYPNSIINTEFQSDRLLDEREVELLNSVRISDNPVIVLFKF